MIQTLKNKWNEWVIKKPMQTKIIAAAIFVVAVIILIK
mgnify:FL=1